MYFLFEITIVIRYIYIYLEFKASAECLMEFYDRTLILVYNLLCREPFLKNLQETSTQPKKRQEPIIKGLIALYITISTFTTELQLYTLQYLTFYPLIFIVYVPYLYIFFFISLMFINIIFKICIILFNLVFAMYFVQTVRMSNKHLFPSIIILHFMERAIRLQVIFQYNTIIHNKPPKDSTIARFVGISWKIPF